MFVPTGGSAMRGGAVHAQHAPRVCAGGRGVYAGEESDHERSHGPVTVPAGPVGEPLHTGVL